MDETGDPEAHGVEVRAYKGKSKVSFDAALKAAVVLAVETEGPGKWWEVHLSVRGDNPRVGEYRVVLSETVGESGG